MSIRSQMRETALVETPAARQDGLGGASRTWATRHAALPVAIQPLSSRAVIEFARLNVRATHQAFTPDGSAITTSDRITVGGLRYEIVDVINPCRRGGFYKLLLRQKAS